MKTKLGLLWVVLLLFGVISLKAQEDINSKIKVGVISEKISNFKLTSFSRQGGIIV